MSKEYTNALDLLHALYDETHKERLCVGTVKNTDDENHKMVGYRMTNENDLIEHDYHVHYEKTYRTAVKTLKPRTFRSEHEVRAYMERVERLAGRTLEDDEWGLLLRTITRGRRYDLVCMIDITETLNEVPRYER